MSSSDSGYYRQEEIAAAIEMARRPDSRTRVIPVFLSRQIPDDVPYGLRQLHAIKGVTSMKVIAEKIGKVVERVANLESDTAATPGSGSTLKSDVSGTAYVSGRMDISPEILRVSPTEEQAAAPKENLSSLNKHEGHNFLTTTLIHKVAQWNELNVHLSVLLLDLDKLTKINNEYSVEVGNQALEIVFEILRNSKAKYYGRCGDDTFYAIFTGHAAINAIRRANLLRRNIEQYPWDRLASGLYVTCSIGVAVLRPREPVPDWLVRAAMGMKEAKRHGGNQVAAAPVFIPRSTSRELRDHYS